MQHPEYLFILLALVPVLLLSYGQYRRSGENLKKIGSKLRENSFYEVFVVKWFFGSLMTVLAVVLCVLALVGFKWEGRIEAVNTRGADVFIVLDISRSMLCGDVSPSRFAKSVATVQSLVESSQDKALVRYGLIVFSGKAFKIVPLTEDRASISGALETVHPALVTTPGTNCEAAITLAVGSFSRSEERDRVILFFSDGEALTGDAEKALAGVRAEDVRVFSVGTGTKEGGHILLGKGEYVLDSSGERVTTRLNPLLLRRFASVSGGEYLDITDPSLASKLSRHISQSGRSVSEYRYRIGVSEVYRPFLGAAIFCLFFSVVVRFLRWKNTF